MADLPVGPPLGDQYKYLNLAPGQAKGGGRRRRRLRFRSRIDRFFEAEAAAPGKQLDLTPLWRGAERDHRVMGGAEGRLDLASGRATGQQRLGQPEARIGGVEAMLELLPSGDRRPPAAWVGSSLQPRQFSMAVSAAVGTGKIHKTT